LANINNLIHLNNPAQQYEIVNLQGDSNQKDSELGRARISNLSQFVDNNPSGTGFDEG
jgi:hypothetical protein